MEWIEIWPSVLTRWYERDGGLEELVFNEMVDDGCDERPPKISEIRKKPISGHMKLR